VKERAVGKGRKPNTQTTPKGTEIPVPKRGEFMRDLQKVSETKQD
jgi:hypothetical protein